MGALYKGDVVKRSDCILAYESTTKGDVVKGSESILVCMWEYYPGWCNIEETPYSMCVRVCVCVHIMYNTQYYHYYAQSCV